MSTVIKPLLRVMFSTMLAGAGGCQAIAALLDKSGEPNQSAIYVPEKDTMLVLVENYQNPAQVELVADHMNRLIAEELIGNKVAPVVNPDRLNTFRSEHPEDYRKMQIYAIGSQLGAMQVLYANITDFTVETVPGAEACKGHAEVRVKILDTRTKQVRWPKDAPEAGYQIILNIPIAADNANINDTAVRSAMSRQLASRVAKLFHDSTSNEPSPPPSYPESDLR